MLANRGLGNSSEGEASLGWRTSIAWILQLERGNRQGVGVHAGIWAGHLVPRPFLLSDSDRGVFLDAMVDMEPTCKESRNRPDMEPYQNGL